MANDVKFEGKERRMPKIEKFLAENDLGSMEAARDLCLSKGCLLYTSLWPTARRIPSARRPRRLQGYGCRTAG